jgi:hypothetical protein
MDIGGKGWKNGIHGCWRWTWAILTIPQVKRSGIGSLPSQLHVTHIGSIAVTGLVDEMYSYSLEALPSNLPVYYTWKERITLRWSRPQCFVQPCTWCMQTPRWLK